MLNRRFTKWALAAITSVSFGALAAEPASAHFPRYGFRHCYGGFHSGFRPVHFGGFSSSFHRWGGFGHVSSFRVSPWCFAPRYSFCPPVVAWPVSTYYVAPTYYVEPTYFVDPCAPTWGSVSFDVGVPFASTRGPSNFLSNRSIASLPSPSASVPKWGNGISKKSSVRLAASGQTDSKQNVRSSSVQIQDKVEDTNAAMYVASKPRLVQPYSPIWTKAAVGVVDDMIEAGRFDDAQASCQSMEKIEQPKGAGVYLRQGLMKYFATQNHSTASTDRVLSLLDQACVAGSRLSAEELNCESLREYFAACVIDMDSTLESLSKSVLETPENSEREMLLLTVLLKLDGQTERARLFANEAEQLASRSSAFRWDSLLLACIDSTAR